MRPWQPAPAVTDLTNEEGAHDMPDGTVTWQGRVYDLAEVTDLVDLSAALAADDEEAARLHVDIQLAVAEEKLLSAEVEAAQYKQQIAEYDLAVATAPERARDAELQRIRDYHRRNYPG
jgi:hypothetical protein